MKRIILMVSISILILTSCRQIEEKPITRVTPKYEKGDLVQTKFYKNYLIIDTATEGLNIPFQGVYKVKDSWGTEKQLEEIEILKVLIPAREKPATDEQVETYEEFTEPL